LSKPSRDHLNLTTSPSVHSALSSLPDELPNDSLAESDLLQPYIDILNDRASSSVSQHPKSLPEPSHTTHSVKVTIMRSYQC